MSSLKKVSSRFFSLQDDKPSQDCLVAVPWAGTGQRYLMCCSSASPHLICLGLFLMSHLKTAEQKRSPGELKSLPVPKYPASMKTCVSVLAALY